MPTLARTRSMPGLPELEPDRKERAEQSEDRAARADRRHHRRAKVDDAQAGRDERNHIDDQHAPRPDRIFDEAAEEHSEIMFTAMWSRAAVQKRAGDDAPPLTVLQNGRRKERPFARGRAAYLRRPKTTARPDRPTLISHKKPMTLRRMRNRVIMRRVILHDHHAREFERNRMLHAADFDGHRPAERRLLDDADACAGAQTDLAEIAQDFRHLFGHAAARRARASASICASGTPVRTGSLKS